MAQFAIQAECIHAFNHLAYSLVPGESSLLSLLDTAKTDGANFVEFGGAYRIDLATGAITDNFNAFGDTSPRLSDIGPAIAAAHARGLDVMLMPQVNGPDGNLLVDPSTVIQNPSAFFAGYKQLILNWAQVAEQNHAGIFLIGNEMMAATKPEYTGYWNDIIDSVRQVYHGSVSYGALVNEVSQIQFWSKLDYVGFDPFPTLTNHPDPTIAELDAAWKPIEQHYANLVAGLGKPVLFTSTGIASFPGANENTAANAPPGSPPDYAEQANYWTSFFDTFGAEKPSWLAGVFQFANDPNVNANPPNPFPFASLNFAVNGKPAEQVISTNFHLQEQLTFTETSANEIFAGNSSHNTIIFHGARTDYSAISAGAGVLLVTDSAPLRDGNDTVAFIEHLQFSDKTLFVENADNANIARLYSAAFNRAPDETGLNFWEDVYSSNVSSLTKSSGYYVALAKTNDGSGHSIASDFMGSSEFQNRYGSLTDTAFVTLLYQNVLGRGPDQAGLNFWTGQLATSQTREVVLVGFAESPENVAKTSADWLIQV